MTPIVSISACIQPAFCRNRATLSSKDIDARSYHRFASERVEDLPRWVIIPRRFLRLGRSHTAVAKILIGDPTFRAATKMRERVRELAA
jgi:hypothetical protein